MILSDHFETAPSAWDRNLFRRIDVAMKRILVIYTGGTIGMVGTPNGYAPEKELC